MKEFAGAQVFVNYISLTIVYNAFALVCVFSKMKMNSTEVKVISALAPAAFEVYLIHSQTVIWDHFMTDAFTWIAGSSIWLVPFEVPGSTLGVFLVCLLIEKNTAGCLSKNWNQQSDPESRRKNGSVYSEDMEQIQNSHSLTTESRTTEGNKTQIPRRRLLSRFAFALRFCSTSAAVST